MKWKRLQLGVLAVVLVLLIGVLWQRQAIADWWRLRGYTPPAAVVTLATADTMTPAAEHLFYVNRPNISNGSIFTANCPAGTEKTVVLGCYIGNDGGIYIYKVIDSRLDGVEQVTAAHEMLHAAYRRLNSDERSKVDAMLMSYYEHGLADQRIKDTIAAYKKSEPHDVVNEMHSVFGTEIAKLPRSLETYYGRYFTDRAAIAAYTARYEGEFTGRQQQVAAYDTQLATLKQQIDANKALLTGQRTDLSTRSQRLQAEKDAGSTAAYNRDVPAYNAAVDEYNKLLQRIRSEVSQYNALVEQRNAIVLEEQQLIRAISPGSVTTAP